MAADPPASSPVHYDGNYNYWDTCPPAYSAYTVTPYDWNVSVTDCEGEYNKQKGCALEWFNNLTDGCGFLKECCEDAYENCLANAGGYLARCYKDATDSYNACMANCGL
jgi:hypothetical protein